MSRRFRSACWVSSQPRRNPAFHSSNRTVERFMKHSSKVAGTREFAKALGPSNISIPHPPDVRLSCELGSILSAFIRFACAGIWPRKR
jgi:hypothetical protein